jgi:hypothetical protein
MTPRIVPVATDFGPQATKHQPVSVRERDRLWLVHSQLYRIEALTTSRLLPMPTAQRFPVV